MGNRTKQYVTSGIRQLDHLLGGGIIIGDNVVWYDDAGSLAEVFCLNLIEASESQKRHIIYVNFDRSPKNLLEKLGPLADSRYLTILDCFTLGKGEGAGVFLKFYEEKKNQGAYRIVKAEDPGDADKVMQAVYDLHKTMSKDVRLVFESLTGMQELWGSEDQILRFYARSCPRLYELNTIAYWIVEKEAHSLQLKAHLNKITQVAIDLSLKRGKTSLTVIKAEKRDIELLNKQTPYWNRDLMVHFDPERKTTSRLDLGIRIKELRTQRGLSQTELAKSVGVTPSTISQVENNQIYPSLPALIKMTEILSIDISSLFKSSLTVEDPVVFPEMEAKDVHFPNIPKDAVYVRRMTPMGMDAQTEPYLIEFPPDAKLNSHFFLHKGEEVGFLISGELKLHLGKGTKQVKAGDLICLTNQIPLQWENPGPDAARLLWIKIK
jgi:transcriptional regulator with XRE-family HTH domain/KaiC/GvpD/RAD55 family RecA-like ATPase